MSKLTLFEYLDRAGQRRNERYAIAPPRPRDSKMLVGVLFFLGYYVLVFAILRVAIPAENAPLVRDAMLVLGPVIGAIGQALFRTDIKDEIATQNTGEAFRAQRAQAEATKAAADSIPNSHAEASGARAVAGAAVDKASQIEGMETDV